MGQAESSMDRERKTNKGGRGKATERGQGSWESSEPEGERERQGSVEEKAL